MVDQRGGGVFKRKTTCLDEVDDMLHNRKFTPGHLKFAWNRNSKLPILKFQIINTYFHWKS